ncbi:hypothetical protein [Streptomyces sp. UG1]|uniref:hypothetical protein n=1 Tax=Streptomyces sp. UG1 TaxID=3417652 RepID=UPI003CF7091D
MTPPKPTSPKDTDARKKKQRVFPADFDEFVTATAAELGDGWTVDVGNKPHPKLSAYLTHPDGRRIGIKHLWRGETVQIWALVVPPREFDNDSDAEAYANSLKQLTPGIRYNVGVCFTNNPPAATAAKNIRTRLLPAFDGKRPPLRAFSKKRSRRTSVTEKTPANANVTTLSSTKRSADRPEPEETTAKPAAPAKTPGRTTKKAQPTEEETEPKKRPAARRSRRSTPPADKAKTEKEPKAQETRTTETSSSG